eukprot:scaffold149581_cov31-Prasinocladus_malaysianus.AAC.1
MLLVRAYSYRLSHANPQTVGRLPELNLTRACDCIPACDSSQSNYRQLYHIAAFRITPSLIEQSVYPLATILRQIGHWVLLFDQRIFDADDDLRCMQACLRRAMSA